MDTVKISWRKAKIFSDNCPTILAEEKHFTKLKFALEKMFKKIKAMVDSEYNENLVAIEMEYALTRKVEKRDVPIMDGNKFTFAKEDQAKVREAKRKFLEDPEQGIEITPHFVDYDQVPHYFTLEIIDLLENIILKPLPEEELEKWYLSRENEKPKE